MSDSRQGLTVLFAPWRMEYVSRDGSAAGCVFCTAAKGDEDSLWVMQGATCFALLNRYPYTSGHLMVAPRRHVADLSALDTGELAELMETARRLVEVLRDVYEPHGFNLGMNLGEAAGAGIADHLHLHVVPRWRGDTNAMTTTGTVRVIPEDLAETRLRIRRALEAPRD